MAATAMNRLIDALCSIGQVLDRAQKDWVLVGGLAISARAEPRFTRDVDIAVAVASDAEAERLVAHLQGVGYRLFQVVEQDAVDRMATARLIPPSGEAAEVVIDLLFASSGIEAELVAAAESLEVFPDIRVPVPRVGHLIALKLLSEGDERLQDRLDLRALVAVADHAELERAREAVGLIRARNFHRGRDLLAALDALVAGTGQAEA
jgi:predicted nucleotidyltransferase